MIIDTQSLGSPHDGWFEEAFYGFGDAALTGSWELPRFSDYEYLLLRVIVTGDSNPRNQFYWDDMALYAVIYLNTTLTDKQVFCEQAVHQLLDLVVGALFERHPVGFGGAMIGYCDVVESERRITRCCELFGQPRSAWNTGPLHLQVREAAIELLKERCANPALLKVPGSRSELKLQIFPIMPVGYVHPNPVPLGYSTPPPRWTTVPGAPYQSMTYDFRARRIDNFYGGFGSEYGYDKLPVLKDGLYYDVNPGRAWFITPSGSGAPPAAWYFPELTPPEWREFLDLFAIPPDYDITFSYEGSESHYDDDGNLWTGGSPVGYSERQNTWTDDQTYLIFAKEPIRVEFGWSHEWFPVGSGYASATTITGVYEAASGGPGQIIGGDIRYGSHLGYEADFKEWPVEGFGHVAGHWFISQNEMLLPIWEWREPYDVDWGRVTINVVGQDGRGIAGGGGSRGGANFEVILPSGGGVPADGIWVKGSPRAIGPFDNSALAPARVVVSILAGNVINYSNDGTVLPWTTNYGHPEDEHPFYPPGFPEWPAALTQEQRNLLLGDKEQYAKWMQDNFGMVDGVMGYLEIRAYNVPMSTDLLIPETPPWKMTKGPPGILNTGPLLSGSHATVSRRTGRVTGR